MAEIVAKLIEFAERYWRRPRTRVLLPVAASLLLLGHLSDYGAKPLEFRDLALAALLAVVLYYFWIWDNKVPTIPKGTAGVVLALSCENSAHDKQVRTDLVNTLRQLLTSDQAATRFHFLDLPPHHARRCLDHESSSTVLREARGHLLLYGNVRLRTVNSVPAHIVSLEGVVRHTNQSPEVRSKISADFRAALPRRVQFGLDNDAFAFEATSEWTEVAARYVIGLAAFVSGDVWYAEELLLSVEGPSESRRGVRACRASRNGCQDDLWSSMAGGWRRFTSRIS